MLKYRLRGAEVEAMQITNEVLDAPHPSDLHVTGLVYDPVNRTVRKVVGVSRATVGYWIVQDELGGISFWNPDDFKRTYEPVDPPDA
jgi:hypothetical protein